MTDLVLKTAFTSPRNIFWSPSRQTLDTLQIGDAVLILTKEDAESCDSLEALVNAVQHNIDDLFFNPDMGGQDEPEQKAEIIETQIIKDETTVDGISTTRTIVIKHPVGNTPRGAGEFDTTNHATLTPSGMGKMHTWLMMTNDPYRKANEQRRKEIITEWLFDPRINKEDGSIRFVRNYQEQETLTCHLLKDQDIATVYAITKMVTYGVDYGNQHAVKSGGDTSHRAKSDFAYRGYGA